MNAAEADVNMVTYFSKVEKGWVQLLSQSHSHLKLTAETDKKHLEVNI